MSNTQSRPASLTDYQIKRRPCPQCKGMMLLTCIEPGKPGFDLRSFECRDCPHVESDLVQIDPVPSGARGRVSGRLSASR
jgi:hypothetical protein